MKRQRFLSENISNSIIHNSNSKNILINLVELKLEKTNSKSAEKTNIHINENPQNMSKNDLIASSQIFPIQINPVVEKESFTNDSLQNVLNSTRIMEKFNLIVSNTSFEYFLFDDIGLGKKISEIKLTEKRFKALNILDNSSADETSDFSGADYSSSNNSADSDSSSDLELNVVDECEINPVDYSNKNVVLKNMAYDDKNKGGLTNKKMDLGKIIRKFNNTKEACKKNEFSIDMCMVINHSKLFKK